METILQCNWERDEEKQEDYSASGMRDKVILK